MPASVLFDDINNRFADRETLTEVELNKGVGKDSTRIF